MKNKIYFRILLFCAFLSQLNIIGQTWDWTKRVGTQYVSDSYTDNNGNTFLTGGLSGTRIIGTNTLTGTHGDVYVTKIDSNGTVIWAVEPANSTNVLDGIAVSGDSQSGGCYFLCQISGTTTAVIGSYSITGNSNGVGTYFLSKLDNVGNVVWVKKLGTAYYGGVNTEQERGDLKCDVLGNVYVTGTFTGTMTIGSQTLTTHGGSGHGDVFIAKFDSNGNALWARNAGNNESTIGTSIAVDQSGNSYVTGYFYSTLPNTTYFGNLSFTTSASSNGIYLVKYNASGVEQFVANGKGGKSRGIEVDNSGNSYITGILTGTLNVQGYSVVSYTNASFSSNDPFIVKFSSTGQVIFVRHGGSGQGGGGQSGDELGAAIVVSPNHEAIVAGDFYTTGVFGGLSVTSNTATLKSNAFMVKYSLTGTENMLIQNGNAGSSTRAMGIGLDVNQSMYVAGTHIGTGSFGSQNITYNEVDSCVYLTKIRNIISSTDVVVSVSQIGGSNPMCFGSSATFSATVINGGSNPSYQWFVNGSPVGTNTSTYSSTSLTNNSSVYCTVMSNMAGATNNPATSEDIIVNVGNMPASVNSVTICAGQTTTLTPMLQYAVSSYSWSNGATSLSIAVSPTVTTVYTATLNFSGGCSKIITSTVSVLSTTNNITISAPSTSLCPKSGLTLTVSGANTYTWTNGPSSFTYNTLTPSVTSVYTVTGTFSNGCTKTATKIINVYAITQLTAVASATSICRGNSVTISALGAASYTVSGTITPGPVTRNPSSTTVYTVAGVESVHSCNIRDTIRVNVDNSALFFANAPSYSVCAGNNEILTATSNPTINYLWTPGNLTGTLVTVAPMANTIYTVVGTSSTCTYTNTLNIVTKPAATLTVSSTGTLTCISQPTLYASASPSVTYAWYYKIGATLYSAGSTSTSVVAGLNYPYYCKVTYTPNACVTTGSIAIQVDNASPLLTYTTPSSICNGINAQILVDGATSYNLNYTGTTTNTVFAVTPTVTTTYTLVGVGSNGCSKVLYPQIIVNSNPTVSILGAGPICDGSIINLSSLGATTYTWSTGSTNSFINDSPSATTIYSVVGADINNCIGTATLQVLVNPSPTVSVNNGLICEGESYTIVPSGALSYTYSGGSDVVSPTVTTNYTVTGENSLGCSTASTLQIVVNPKPIISIFSNSIVCSGSSAYLNVSGANTYTWNTGATTSSNTVTPTTTSTYTVSGTDLNNCSNTQTVSVTVDNTCQDVWPGDANSDGTADNLDVLELGLHYTQTGAPRTSVSNTWQSYFANNWTGTIANGKNLNHSDCNGDGTINNDDTLAIYNNYGLNHTFKPVQTNTVNPQLSIVPDQSTVVKGTWGSASIYLGDAATNVNNVNGVAFTLDFDNSLIETNSIYIEYQNSFIDAGQNLHFRKLDFANSKLFAASTHTASNNVSGNGLIAKLHYQIISSLTTDEVLNIGLSQANQSNASGIITPLTVATGTLMAIGASVGLQELNGNVVSVSPNPTNGSLTINSKTELQKIEVVSITGQVLLSEVPTNVSHTLHLDNFSNGIYFVNLYQNNCIVKREKVILNK